MAIAGEGEISSSLVVIYRNDSSGGDATFQGFQRMRDIYGVIDTIRRSAPAASDLAGGDSRGRGELQRTYSAERSRAGPMYSSATTMSSNQTRLTASGAALFCRAAFSVT